MRTMETDRCADCGEDGVLCDTPAGEVLTDDHELRYIAEGRVILCASAYGDHLATCDECEVARSAKADSDR